MPVDSHSFLTSPPVSEDYTFQPINNNPVGQTRGIRTVPVKYIGETVHVATYHFLLAGNLSGQSSASVLHPQQTLHPPGSIPETGQSQLLQPLKPSPSSDNLYSAFTSDGAMSIPSLSAPGQGKKSKQSSSSKNIKMEILPCL